MKHRLQRSTTGSPRCPTPRVVLVGHDYQPSGRPLRYKTTVGASKAGNIQLTLATTREQFIALRTMRDATLAAPRLLFPSVRVNIDAGRLPTPHANGVRCLRVPLNMKTPTGDDGIPSSRETGR